MDKKQDSHKIIGITNINKFKIGQYVKVADKSQHMKIIEIQLRNCIYTEYTLLLLEDANNHTEWINAMYCKPMKITYGYNISKANAILMDEALRAEKRLNDKFDEENPEFISKYCQTITESARQIFKDKKFKKKKSDAKSSALIPTLMT